MRATVSRLWRFVAVVLGVGLAGCTISAEPETFSPSNIEHPVPGSFSETLPPGTFALLLEVPVVEEAGAIPFGSSPFVALEEVVIVGPEGPLSDVRVDRSATAIGGSYRGAVRFVVAIEGTYELEITTSEPTRALLQLLDP